MVRQSGQLEKTHNFVRFLQNLLYILPGLARFKPSGYNRGLNHGLNQVVFFLKKPISFFGFFLPPRKIQIFFLGLKFLYLM